MSGKDFSYAVGESFTVRFGDTWVSFRLPRSVPNSEIVWEVTDCHLSWLTDTTEWKGTRIVWEISVDGDRTKIQFTHVGLVPQMECYKDCALGWSSNPGKSLRRLVQDGQGLPDQF